MKLVKKITLEDVMSKVDDYSIYRYYVGEFTIGTTFQGPFERQSSPSFGIYSKDRKLYYSDFSDPDIHGDCVQLVQQMFQLTYSQAIEKIAHDFGISTGTNEYKRIIKSYVKPIMDEKRYCLIQVAVRKWDERSIQYWADYGITVEQLQREEVYCLKEAYINRVKQKQSKDELAFCYRYPSGYKLYYPERTGNDKWKMNIGKVIENIQDIDRYDKIVISKSKKDRMVLKNLFPDIGVINLQNESPSSYTGELIEKLIGKQVWISFDSDPDGKKASMKMNEKYPWMAHINVPDWFLENLGCKDWSDVMQECGEYPIVKHFKEKKIII